MLFNQDDGYPQGTNSPFNTGRWKLLSQNLEARLNHVNAKLSPDGMIRTMTTISGIKVKSPRKGFANLYNTGTQQMIFYTPADRLMKVWFRPVDNSIPEDPVPLFFEISLEP